MLVLMAQPSTDLGEWGCCMGLLHESEAILMDGGICFRGSHSFFCVCRNNGQGSAQVAGMAGVELDVPCRSDEFGKIWL